MSIISEKMKLEQLISQSDIVITGEGKYDYQTKFGKVVSKVKSLSPDALVLCGINESGSSDRVFDLVSRFGIEKSINNTEECIDIIIEEIVNSMYWSSKQVVNSCINNSG
jgi:glycerate kinase